MRAKSMTLALGAIAALSLFGSKSAQANDFYVTPANLPAAINSAANGDTIYVSAGVCNSHVTVNKTLNIRGTQADTPGIAPSRGVSETNLANGVTVSASGVQLNGLVISGGDMVGDITGTGVLVRSTVIGLLFTNNIVQDNTFGLYLNGAGHIVQNNYFYNNNRPGSARGDGIYSDFGLRDAIISNNAFRQNQAGSVVILGGVKSGTVDNITIVDNSIINDGTIALYGASNVTVSGNLVCNIANGHGLMIGGGNNHITVYDNQFLASQYRGIRVSAGGKYSANKDVRIYNNDIANNRQGGLSVVDGAYTDNGTRIYDQNADGKVDAECNSWGAITGPNAAGNPGGTGDKVAGNAKFIPFRKYMVLTNHVSGTLLQTYSNVSTRTYLQVVRITNNGGKAVVGPGYFTLDGFAANGVQLDNATGTQDDACLPPLGSPWYTFETAGNQLLPCQSVIVTLKFTTNVGVTFNTTKIGGTDGTIANPVTRRVLAANYR